MFRNNFGPQDSCLPATKNSFQGERGSSNVYRNSEAGRYFQPVHQGQIDRQKYQVGDRVMLRVRGLDNQDRYFTTIIRNIVSYETAKSVLGSYNEEDGYNGAFVSVLVLDQVF
jgi:transcription termination factor Rho